MSAESEVPEFRRVYAELDDVLNEPLPTDMRAAVPSNSAYMAHNGGLLMKRKVRSAPTEPAVASRETSSRGLNMDEARQRELEWERRQTIAREQRAIMYYKPRPIPGLDSKGRIARAEAYRTKKARMALYDRGLSTKGDSKQLQLRLLRAQLKEDITAFDNTDEGKEKTREEKHNLLLRRLVEMGNAEVWKNFGNDNVQRFVETFTTVSYVGGRRPERRRLGRASPVSTSNEAAEGASESMLEKEDSSSGRGSRHDVGIQLQAAKKRAKRSTHAPVCSL